MPIGISLAWILTAQKYAVGAILAEYPTPQRVVQVQDETLLALQVHFLLNAFPPCLEIVRQLGIEQRLGHQIIFPIHQVITAIVGSELTEIHPLDTRTRHGQMHRVAVKTGYGFLDGRLISRKSQSEQIYQGKNNEVLALIGAAKHQIQLIPVGLQFLGQLDTIGIDRHLIEPDVAVNIAWHHADVVITRIGHAVIPQEILNGLITKDKRLFHILISLSCNKYGSGTSTAQDTSLSDE